CLKANKNLPEKIPDLYRDLGVEEKPSFVQVISTLSGLTDRGTELKQTYVGLLNLLSNFNGNINYENYRIDKICLLTCADIYKPISECYWSNDIGSPDLIEKTNSHLVINKKDCNNQSLISWIRRNNLNIVKDLHQESTQKLIEIPKKVELTPDVTYFIKTWEDLFTQLCKEDSTLYEELQKYINKIPEVNFTIVPVEKISVQFFLRDGNIVKPSSLWTGIEVFPDNYKIYLKFNKQLKSDGLGKLDQLIASQIVKILYKTENKELEEIFLNYLERPSVVLSRLKKDKSDLIFYQYQDQTGDPEFAKLFDEYRQTKDGTRRKKHVDELMMQRIREEFINMRRTQIRNHGYNEFSIFTELLQNAEDAYIQRDILGMEPVETEISFLYKFIDNAKRCLIVEHFGRPFNYWRHNEKEESNFKRDVEGVIKSAGSFKPSSAQNSEQLKTIGRFGLGFKSVFLITDKPIIHSGQWHFEITHGCIPEELTEFLPDLDSELTRIELPLREDSEELSDPDGEKLINLLPFLSKIKKLNLTQLDESSLSLQTTVEQILSDNENNLLVEIITISGATYVRDKQIKIIRCRHKNHEGQMGMYISSNNIPAQWNEVFDRDIFAVLPLQIKL
ncbi:MAG: hypothetical protein ABRQ37_27435, partial [Candidatus Eremiobacterota bacterium]